MLYFVCVCIHDMLFLHGQVCSKVRATLTKIRFVSLLECFRIMAECYGFPILTPEECVAFFREVSNTAISEEDFKKPDVWKCALLYFCLDPRTFCVCMCLCVWWLVNSWGILLVEHWTRDRKVASSNPSRSSGRIFFSKVNFMCWLIQCPFHPHVTSVARKRSWSFCQKCRWQVTPKQAYTLDPMKSEWADYLAIQA